ncbi:putative pentatricopeptide repeat-containing protein At5g37570 isoform X2 [Lycium ferocissimum]|uniref:putative pentatricopeptide repeat-containing protein At5g37570 isoform X1 n=1 Tax=Lycium ferocissimum TaxID=112874 RepID=UPI0028165207|nr:putative pentatricopeptide repeat-containing protein At5g37570 isoform X1 [Lycium ferocissimum]XP_059280535.1 putative pentatricopeptide repeat-containing protein At5g37570 isoform X1 [Lycium ferocissimum]XP_059280537.1 putative pentatricopeptide repeat-containing protein At5g37570 isoform X1 [Lycium ferocissimum]XP_059280538.1 putative pentatricopeptide repeat-containing protein At5g37570 isoform X2 [Lycium ferocissimum]
MSLISKCLTTSTEPSSLSIPILNLLRACKTIKNLLQVHTHIIQKGYEQDHFIINQFISLCNTFSFDVSYATSVFERVIQPNVYVWNTLIKGYSKQSSLAGCFVILKQMKRSMNVIPDKYTFPSLVKSCSNALALREGQTVHGLIIRYGTDSDVYVGSSLIDLYGKCNQIEHARRIFNEMPLRNEVTWTAMIVGYIYFGDLLQARKLFDEMPKRNIVSWNAMISAFVRFGDLVSARKLFDSMPDKDAVSFTTMIDGYAKAGDMASARFLFDQSFSRDIISWSALISGYAQNGQPNEAIKIFHEMLSMNVRPDEFIMVSLMCACSQLGRLDLANWVENYMSQNSFDLNQVHIAAALVDMNAKCGNMERATMLFEGMTKRDLVSYCSMIQGLSIHGCGSQAVAFFDRMLNEGLVPDDVSLKVILTACSRAELVKEGCRIFNLMINKYSVNPSPDHYACVVDLLGRSGKLKDAYEIIRSMPVEPHAGAWGALLGACKLHCDIEVGEEVSRRLFELEPQNTGNYVLLSDIYAAANRWLDVALLRQKMTEKGLRKIPGCSSWV